MSKFDEIQEILTASFSKLSDYLQIETRPTFTVIDYKNDGSMIVQDTTDRSIDDSKCLTVSNVRQVGFIPIDGRQGLIGFGTSQCDFVFFDNSNFCFVEFKLNATSLEKNTVAKNRGKAINQLEETIKLFDEKTNRNYANLILEAYVCTPPEYPQNDANWKGLAVTFLEKNGIEVFEQNYKICQS
jgi:Holliday junction resolvase-like predicted endonuclease